MPAAIHASIHIHNGAIPKARHSATDPGTCWIDLDSTDAGATVLFVPTGAGEAINYLNDLITAAAELRDAIAARSGLCDFAAAA